MTFLKEAVVFREFLLGSEKLPRCQTPLQEQAKRRRDWAGAEACECAGQGGGRCGMENAVERDV